MKHPAQIHFDHRRPAVDVEISDRPDLADPGVAHQYVEPSELVDGAGNELVEVGAAGDVGLAADGPPTRCPDLARKLIEPIAAPSTEDHRSTAFRE